MWVLFFDGDCAFCLRSVRWVARWDSRGHVFFASLQGRLAREKGFARHADGKNGTMVVLRESDGKVFTRSDAWIELARALGGCWRVLTLMRLVPKRLRDWVYRWLARNRHHLMGRADACLPPDPEWRKRLRD